MERFWINSESVVSLDFVPCFLLPPIPPHQKNASSKDQSKAAKTPRHNVNTCVSAFARITRSCAQPFFFSLNDFKIQGNSLYRMLRLKKICNSDARRISTAQLLEIDECLQDVLPWKS